MQIEHLGIAVKDFKKSIPLFEALLGTRCYKTEQVESENVHTAFFKAGESKVELLQSDDEQNVINKFITKRGEGLHHIALKVDNILQEMERLKKSGFSLLNETPKLGADNKRICFINPKETNGVLIELCEEIKNG